MNNIAEPKCSQDFARIQVFAPQSFCGLLGFRVASRPLGHQPANPVDRKISTCEGLLLWIFRESFDSLIVNSLFKPQSHNLGPFRKKNHLECDTEFNDDSVLASMVTIVCKRKTR